MRKTENRIGISRGYTLCFKFSAESTALNCAKKSRDFLIFRALQNFRHPMSQKIKKIASHIMKKFHNKPHNFDYQVRLFQKSPCTLFLFQRMSLVSARYIHCRRQPPHPPRIKNPPHISCFLILRGCGGLDQIDGTT